MRLIPALHDLDSGPLPEVAVLAALHLQSGHGHPPAAPHRGEQWRPSQITHSQQHLAHSRHLICVCPLSALLKGPPTAYAEGSLLCHTDLPGMRCVLPS